MNLYNFKSLFASLIAITILMTSCQKEKEAIDLSTGKAKVTVKMNGIGLGTAENPLLRSSTGAKSQTTSTAQTVTVPFSKDLVVRATLTEVEAVSTSGLRASANRAETTSTGAGNIVAFNGDYTIRIYKAGSTILETTIARGGGSTNTFELEPGNYKFVVSAYGNSTGTGSDKAPLWQEINQTITAGSNILDIVLKHKLSEVTVKFDAGSGRTISAIGGGSMEPNFNSFTFDEASGLVTFAGTATAKSFSFPTQPTAQIWTSNPVTIAVGTTNTGKVKLNPVTINGKVGNIELAGLSFKQGVQYNLTLSLGAKEGIEIAGGTWANGNLEYNPGTGVYSFGEINSIGNYWFLGRLLPKRVDGTNYAADGTNGGNGDPCALAAPAGFWRLPKEAEVLSLISGTDGNPPKRYTDNYAGTAATPNGVFFGVPTTYDGPNHPGATRDKYLFMVLSGYYSNDDSSLSNTIGREGSYMVSANTGNSYKEWHFTGTTGTIAWSITPPANPQVGRAMQIRCIKN